MIFELFFDETVPLSIRITYFGMGLQLLRLVFWRPASPLQTRGVVDDFWIESLLFYIFQLN